MVAVKQGITLHQDPLNPTGLENRTEWSIRKMVLPSPVAMERDSVASLGLRTVIRGDVCHFHARAVKGPCEIPQFHLPDLSLGEATCREGGAIQGSSLHKEGSYTAEPLDLRHVIKHFQWEAFFWEKLHVERQGEFKHRRF